MTRPSRSSAGRRPPEAAIDRLRSTLSELEAELRHRPDLVEPAEQLRGIVTRLERETAVGNAAAELAPVIRLLDGHGLPHLAQEISRARRSITLGEERAEPTAPPPVEELPRDPDESKWQEPARSSSPWPLVGLAGLLVVAAVASVTLVVLQKDERHGRAGGETETAAQAPTPTRAPDPAPTTAPTPRVQPTDDERTRFLDALGEARLALQRDQLGVTLDHLDIASSFDAADPRVIEIATTVRARWIDRAHAAMSTARYAEAAEAIAEAEAITERFALDAGPVEDARRRLDAADRFEIVGASERARLRGAIGRRIEVVMADGTVVPATLKAVGDTTLTLDRERMMQGGALRFTEDVPLAGVELVRVYETR